MRISSIILQFKIKIHAFQTVSIARAYNEFDENSTPFKRHTKHHKQANTQPKYYIHRFNGGVYERSLA